MISKIESMTPFGSSALIAGQIARKPRPARYISNTVDKAASKKESAAETLKQMLYELFPKLDPDYQKVFGHIDKKV